MKRFQDTFPSPCRPGKCASALPRETGRMNRASGDSQWNRPRSVAAASRKKGGRHGRQPRYAQTDRGPGVPSARVFQALAPGAFPSPRGATGRVWDAGWRLSGPSPRMAQSSARGCVITLEPEHAGRQNGARPRISKNRGLAVTMRAAGCHPPPPPFAMDMKRRRRATTSRARRRKSAGPRWTRRN